MKKKSCLVIDTLRPLHLNVKFAEGQFNILVGWYEVYHSNPLFEFWHTMNKVNKVTVISIIEISLEQNVSINIRVVFFIPS